MPKADQLTSRSSEHTSEIAAERDRLRELCVEMLAELKKIDNEWDGEPCDMYQARAAIAKAEGK